MAAIGRSVAGIRQPQLGHDGHVKKSKLQIMRVFSLLGDLDAFQTKPLGFKDRCFILILHTPGEIVQSPIWHPKGGRASDYMIEVFDVSVLDGMDFVDPTNTLIWDITKSYAHYLGIYKAQTFLDHRGEFRIDSEVYNWRIGVGRIEQIQEWIQLAAPELNLSHVEIESFGGPA